MAQMTVQVVTPDGLKYDHHANFIHAVTKDGQIGILPGHINLIAPLEVDELKVRRVDDENHVDWIAVNGGIIEVKDDLITIVADSAERERDIDVSRAERAKQRAERDLEEATKSDRVKLLFVEHLTVSVSVLNKSKENETLFSFFYMS